MEADTCPHFYKRLGHHVANKKLAKMYCPSRKRSQKRLIVHVHVEPKKCRVLIDWLGFNGTFSTVRLYRALSGGARLKNSDVPHFKLRSGAAIYNGLVFFRPPCSLPRATQHSRSQSLLLISNLTLTEVQGLSAFIGLFGPTSTPLHKLRLKKIPIVYAL